MEKSIKNLKTLIYSNDYLTASEWKNFLNQEVKQLPTMIAEAPKDVETFIDKLKRDEHNGVFLIGNQKKETPHSGQPFNKPCTNNNAITAVSNKDEIYKVMQTQALIMEKQMLLLEEQIGIIKRLLPPIKAN